MNEGSYKSRTPWQVTRSVWHALFIREALTRTMSDRFSWFWMIAEPSLFVLLMIAMRQVLGKVKLITGADYIPWLLLGFLTFILFRTILQKSRGVIDASQSLFAYRQVLPIDPVIIRSVVEGLLISFVFILFIIGANLLGLDMDADNPIEAIYIWILTWFFSLGTALIASVMVALVDESKILIQVITLPLMILSGVIIPIQVLPEELHQYFLINPVLHLTESMRLSFFDTYKTLEGINLQYVFNWTVGLLFIGLLLHMRFKEKMKVK